MVAVLEEPEGQASSVRGPEGYEIKTMRTGISVCGGSFGQNGEGSSTMDFEV
jgi:hypothetical protein